MIRHAWKWGLMAACAGAMLGCAAPSVPVMDEAASIRPAAPSGVVLSNPRRATVEFTATFGPIKRLEGEALRAANREQGIPEDTPPTLLVWSAAPPLLPAQTQATTIENSPEPTERFRDAENGNPIRFWDLSDRLEEGAVIEIKRLLIVTTHEWTPLEALNPQLTETSPAIMALYTREEPMIQLTDEMRETALRAIAGADDALGQAARLFQFVRGHMEYVYPPEERNALHALHSGQGDCGQYSYLFIALCRSVKIPARQQSGFRVTDEEVGYHVWSEIYVPPWGWIPVDATEPDGFGRLDNARLVASVGTHIPLRHTPDWATMQNSDVENGRTDFMQFMTTVKSGFEGPVKTDRRVVKIEELP